MNDNEHITLVFTRADTRVLLNDLRRADSWAVDSVRDALDEDEPDIQVHTESQLPKNRGRDLIS